MSATTSRVSGAAFNPLLGLEFLASQFAVFGPVTFSVLLIVLRADDQARDRPRRPPDAVLRDPDAGAGDGDRVRHPRQCQLGGGGVHLRQYAGRRRAGAACGLALDRLEHRDRRRRADRVARRRCQCAPDVDAVARQARRLCAHHGLALARRGGRQARAARPAPAPSSPSSATSSRRCSTTSATPDGRCCHGRRAPSRTIIST